MEARGRAVGSGTVTMADPSEVASWAVGLPERFLICRDVNHRWGAYQAWKEGTARNAGYTRVLKCGGCRTLRVDTLDSQGYKISTKYEYPEGYLHTGMGRMGQDSRAAIRLTGLETMAAKTPARESA